MYRVHLLQPKTKTIETNIASEMLTVLGQEQKPSGRTFNPRIINCDKLSNFDQFLAIKHGLCMAGNEKPYTHTTINTLF